MNAILMVKRGYIFFKFDISLFEKSVTLQRFVLKIYLLFRCENKVEVIFPSNVENNFFYAG